jgi:hypothetical protein
MKKVKNYNAKVGNRPDSLRLTDFSGPRALPYSKQRFRCQINDLIGHLNTLK